MKKPMKKEEMSAAHSAKRNVLAHLSDSMRRHMGMNIRDHMNQPVKRVSVEAPDAESMRKGLAVASQLAPEMDKMSEAAKGIMDQDVEEAPRDMDEAAYDHEEEENKMPDNYAGLMAERMNQDEENEDETEQLRKHLKATV